MGRTTFKERAEELLYDLKNDIRFGWYNFKHGIKNLIRWFPEIWQDRDFDYSYLLALMEKKLRYMQKDMENACHTTAEKDAKDIQSCVEIIHRIRTDAYTDEAYEEVEKRYGKLKMRFNDDTHTVEFWNENIEGDPEKQKEADEFLNELYHDSDLRKDADMAILTNTIKDRLFFWWT